MALASKNGVASVPPQVITMTTTKLVSINDSIKVKSSNRNKSVLCGPLEEKEVAKPPLDSFRLAKTLSEPEGSLWSQCAALTGCFQAARWDLTSRTLKLDVCSATNNNKNKNINSLVGDKVTPVRPECQAEHSSSTRLGSHAFVATAKITTTRCWHSLYGAEHLLRARLGGPEHVFATTKTITNIGRHTLHRDEHLSWAELDDSVYMTTTTRSLSDQNNNRTELSLGEHNEFKDRASSIPQGGRAHTDDKNKNTVCTYVPTV